MATDGVESGPHGLQKYALSGLGLDQGNISLWLSRATTSSLLSSVVLTPEHHLCAISTGAIL
ncbi:hypothetical protein [Rhizobium sp. BE258]|uniref:hypothetical protein n=1 Tax=Rhizobium sp. BE258 TaxID=2817722 RepID=UPI00285CEDFF|nr:hypothetical protein [Rhizobium sp. BE258]MDR7145231.1 hypothetical protein [Rhizobium sp. BE258]